MVLAVPGVVCLVLAVPAIVALVVAAPFEAALGELTTVSSKLEVSRWRLSRLDAGGLELSLAQAADG